MYKLEFTLKQHTPLIHFQHDQIGATLRATEVKPKLDRFIIEKMGGFDILKSEHPKWFIGDGENHSLKYKIRFLSINESEKYVISSYISQEKMTQLIHEFAVIDKAPYFAQEKEIKEYLENTSISFSKLGLMEKEHIQVQLLSVENELLKEINESFSIFLSLESFGTRQNKGFGNFFISKATKEDFEQALFLSNKSHFLMNKRQDGFENIFRTINSEYKLLKSDSQKKVSAIRDYFSGINVEWEKSAIYAHIDNKSVSDKEYKYVRSFLGLAELYEFTKHIPKFKVKIKNLAENPENLISRYKSPITFKVFDGFIYLLYDEIPEEIMGKKFEFSFIGIDKKPLVLASPIVAKHFMRDFLFNRLNKNWRKLS